MWKAISNTTSSFLTHHFRPQSANTAKEPKKALKKGAPGGGKSRAKAAKIPQPAPVLLEAESDAEEPEVELEVYFF